MAMAPTPQPKTLLGHHRVLSPSASIKVSPLCLGTMNFGEIWKDLVGECTKETAFAILDRFYGAGGNFIDTANMYMNGESEQWLGEWMAARGVRDDLVIATKYSTSWKMPFMELEGQILSNYGGNNKKSLRLSLEASLKRLGTSYVDILYVHAWEGTTTIPELMRALDDVVRAGLALYIGTLFLAIPMSSVLTLFLLGRPGGRRVLGGLTFGKSTSSVTITVDMERIPRAYVLSKASTLK